MLFRSVADITHRPVCTDALVRHHHNKTQTHLNRDERWQNVQGIFAVRHPERLAGHHILLIDDVVTTGATQASCIETLTSALPDIRISILALACTRS